MSDAFVYIEFRRTIDTLRLKNTEDRLLQHYILQQQMP
jgi:hypothetical protein